MLCVDPSENEDSFVELLESVTTIARFNYLEASSLVFSLLTSVRDSVQGNAMGSDEDQAGTALRKLHVKVACPVHGQLCASSVKSAYIVYLAGSLISGRVVSSTAAAVALTAVTAAFSSRTRVEKTKIAETAP